MTDRVIGKTVVKGHWRGTLLVGGVLLGAYLLLLNPFWSPGGDSELYASLARSLVRGEGYVYNGQPVRLVPPGYPVVLAAAFSISPTFLAGKLVNLLCMLGAGLLAHRVLLRLVSPTLAIWSAVLGGLLAPAYPLTMWLHTDPLFCLIGWSAALFAVRSVEATGRTRLGWLAALLLACLALPVVRFAAVFQWGIPTAILIGGLSRVGLRRLWIGSGIALGALLVIAVFVAIFVALGTYGDAENMPDDIGSSSAADSEYGLPNVLDNGPEQRPGFLVDRAIRLTSAGQWAAWILWYPGRFASGIPVAGTIVGIIGWFVLALLALAAWPRKGRGVGWVWLATLCYVLLLAIVWPLPNARYLVPIAPLIIAGVLTGVARLNRPAVSLWLKRAFLASLVIVNGLMFAVDVVVQRSPNYYEIYEDGRVTSLIDAIEYLKSRGVKDGELAISERYDNLGRMRFMRSGTREVVLLLDREVITAPDIRSVEPKDLKRKRLPSGKIVPDGIYQWSEREGIRYFLYQRAPLPWRLWHFRLPVSIHKALGGPEPTGEPDGWVLYSMDDNFEEAIDIPPSSRRITRVPGL